MSQPEITDEMVRVLYDALARKWAGSSFSSQFFITTKAICTMVSSLVSSLKTMTELASYGSTIALTVARLPFLLGASAGSATCVKYADLNPSKSACKETLSFLHYLLALTVLHTGDDRRVTVLSPDRHLDFVLRSELK